MIRHLKENELKMIRKEVVVDLFRHLSGRKQIHENLKQDKPSLDRGLNPEHFKLGIRELGTRPRSSVKCLSNWLSINEGWWRYVTPEIT
jgi:hypothetical protein